MNFLAATTGRLRNLLRQIADHPALGPFQPLIFEARAVLGNLLQTKLQAGAGPLYINLGSGADHFDGFVGVDLFGSRAQKAVDLRRPLPIDDATVAGLFSEHTLEHLTYDAVSQLLKECYRTLVPGGRIRIIVPDVSIFIAAYCKNDRQWFASWARHSLEPRGRSLLTPMTAISFVTQEYGHVSAWDFETMKAFLERAGFVDIVQVQYRVGAEEKLILDNPAEDRTLVSLYVEARKPNR